VLHMHFALPTLKAMKTLRKFPEQITDARRFSEVGKYTQG
jgi:hypothetical protein